MLEEINNIKYTLWRFPSGHLISNLDLSANISSNPSDSCQKEINVSFKSDLSLDTAKDASTLKLYWYQGSKIMTVKICNTKYSEHNNIFLKYEQLIQSFSASEEMYNQPFTTE